MKRQKRIGLIGLLGIIACMLFAMPFAGQAAVNLQVITNTPTNTGTITTTPQPDFYLGDALDTFTITRDVGQQYGIDQFQRLVLENEFLGYVYFTDQMNPGGDHLQTRVNNPLSITPNGGVSSGSYHCVASHYGAHGLSRDQICDQLAPGAVKSDIYMSDHQFDTGMDVGFGFGSWYNNDYESHGCIPGDCPAGQVSVYGLRPIYYGIPGENDQDACDGGYMMGDEVATGTVAANSETGNLVELVQGEHYALETMGGPWKADAGGVDRFDAAMSQDGTLWTPIWAAGDCTGNLEPPYSRVYFTSTSGELHIRVNDVAGFFGNNTGSISYRIVGVTPKDPAGSRYLHDGDMEEFPRSSYWYVSDPNGLFGRLVNDDPIGKYFNGEAFCNDGYHAVGPLSMKGEAGVTQQIFYWPGGQFYWRGAIRANHSFLRVMPDSYATVKMIAPNGDEILLLDDYLIPHDVWTVFIPSSSVWLQAGTYNFILEKGRSALSTDVLYFDFFQVANSPLTTACEPDYFGTPTITTTLTGTTTGTVTPPVPPSETPTPTGTIETPTPTETLAPSPTPAPINIANCDFEAGKAGWYFNPQSYIEEPGGPVGSRYAVSAGNSPSISQMFHHPGGYLYMMIYVKGKIAIRYTNLSTGASYYGLTGVSSTWSQQQHISGYIPEGTYRLELNHGSSGNGNYDGISLGANGWNYNGCAATPTPGPTQTPRPSGTVTPGPSPTLNPSATEIATSTAWPTWTRTPINTPTALSGTGSPMPGTVTPGTLTPGTGTVTPVPGTGLPPGEPPPPQPPGAWDAACIRPDNWWNVPWWIDYEFCRATSFVAWGDPNTKQVQQILTSYEQYEPFGTIKEVKDGVSAFQGVINSYNWGSAGLPGQSEAPNPSQFTNPGPSSPWWNGRITIRGGGSSYSTSCNTALGNIVGPLLKQSVCFIFNILYQTHLMPWIQFFINLNSLVVIGYTIWHKWVDIKL